jgi:hypothetical protein
VPLTGQSAITLVHNARRQSEEVRLDGDYRIQRVDPTDPALFKLKIWNVRTGLELDAVLQDDSLAGDSKRIIQDAEWARAPVRLQINARKVGNQYRSAAILSAEALPEQAAAHGAT